MGMDELTREDLLLELRTTRPVFDAVAALVRATHEKKSDDELLNLANAVTETYVACMKGYIEAKNGA